MENSVAQPSKILKGKQCAETSKKARLCFFSLKHTAAEKTTEGDSVVRKSSWMAMKRERGEKKDEIK